MERSAATVKLLSGAHLYRSRNTFLYKITIILLQQINARAANKAITRSPNQYIIYMNSSIAEEKYTTYSIYKCHNNDTTKHHRVDPLVACDNTPKNPFQSNASNLIGSMAVLEDDRKTFLAKGCWRVPKTASCIETFFYSQHLLIASSSRHIRCIFFFFNAFFFNIIILPYHDLR